MTANDKLLAILSELHGLGGEFEEAKYKEHIAGIHKSNAFSDDYHFTYGNIIYPNKPHQPPYYNCYKIPEIIEVEGWCKKILKGENYYFVCGYYELENYYEYEMFIIDWTNKDNSRRVGASVETNRLRAALTIYRDLRTANRLNQNKEKLWLRTRRE